MPSCGVCLSVSLSLSLSLSLSVSVCHVRTFSPSSSQAILVFLIKRHDNIPMGTPLTRASNASGVGRNRDSKPISDFTACC